MDGKTPLFKGLDYFCRGGFPVVKRYDDNPFLGYLELGHTVRISQDGPHPGPVPSGVAAGNAQLHRLGIGPGKLSAPHQDSQTQGENKTLHNYFSSSFFDDFAKSLKTPSPLKGRAGVGMGFMQSLQTLHPIPLLASLFKGEGMNYF